MCLIRRFRYLNDSFEAQVPKLESAKAGWLFKIDLPSKYIWPQNTFDLKMHLPSKQQDICPQKTYFGYDMVFLTLYEVDDDFNPLHNKLLR